MAGFTTINLNGGSVVPSSEIVTKDELFNQDGKIKDYLIDASVEVGVVMTHTCEDADDTPEGISWIKGESIVTGNLEPSAGTKEYIYLVYNSAGDYYEKYVTAERDGEFKWTFFGYSDGGGTNDLKYVVMK